MRVIHFAEILTGGIATYLNELFEYQAAHYDSVTLFCPRSQTHLISSSGVEIVAFDHDGRSPLSLVKMRRLWKRHLAARQYDIIHLHSTFAGLIGRSLRRTKATVIYCAHGWAHGRQAGRVVKTAFGLVELLLSYRAAAVVNVSLSDQTLARDAGIGMRRCRLILSGLGDRSYSPLASDRDGPLKLLFVGRFDRQKGLDTLLTAVSGFRESDFRIRLVGAPVVDRPLAMAVPAHVEELGWLPNHRVQDLIDDSDVVVIPSRWEGLSLIALEASRAARPIVATSIASLAEIVRHGWNGLLVPVDSASALRSAIESLVDLDLRQMGLNARSLYEQRFTTDRMFAEHDELYRQVTKRTQADFHR